MNLDSIKNNTTWEDAATAINSNFSKTNLEVAKIASSSNKHKGFFTTEAALLVAQPYPRVGDNAYVGATYPGVVYVCNTTGVWTATTTVPSPPAVNISEYYKKVETDTLIDTVEANIASLETDLNINTVFNRINIDATTGISLVGVLDGAYSENGVLVIPVDQAGIGSYQSSKLTQSFLDYNHGKSTTLRCVYDILNTSGVFNAFVKNGNTWETISTGVIKLLDGITYYVDFQITIDKNITNTQIVIQKVGGGGVVDELRLFPLSVFPFELSVNNQLTQVQKVIESKIAESVQPQIDTLNSYINEKMQITKGVNVIGSTGYRLGGKFICTNIGYEHNEDYLIERVQVNTNGAGTLHLAVGYIDQRGMAILSKEFSIEVVLHYNDVDVKSKCIVIPAGSYLFAYSMYEGDEDTIETHWRAYSVPDAHQFYYGSIGGIMKQPSLSTYPNGTYLQLGWTGVILEPLFPLKSEFEQVELEIQQALETANNVSARINVVYDRSGNAFDLLAVNGALQIVPKQYGKVLVLSNSTSENGRVYSYGWCGIRGMASSIVTNDYVHKLETGLKTKNSNAEVVICNLWEWEANYRSLHSLSYYLDASLAENPDCIVVRLGENVQDATQLQAELELLINYILTYLSNLSTPIYPALYITSMAMSDAVGQNNAFIAVSNTFHCPYINVSVSGQEYKERAGNYLWGDQTLDGGATWDPSVQVLYKITSTIISHPNDVGMLRIANQILTAMNYSPIDMLHSVSVNNTSLAVPYYFSNWVAGGRCNIQVDNINLVSSVVCTDENNNAIVVTNHLDGVFSFDMPDADVIISIT